MYKLKICALSSFSFWALQLKDFRKEFLECNFMYKESSIYIWKVVVSVISFSEAENILYRFILANQIIVGS
jgi:hypothetical protein